MKKTAILPGGFKPPHAGHYAVATYLAKKSGADVIIRVGSGERDGITQDISIEIWKMYGFKAKPAAKNSPIADVFEYVEKEAEKEEIVYVGTGEKDFPRFKVLTDPSFKPDNYEKYNPKGIKVIEIPVPPQAGGIAGKIMRGFIKNNDKESFQNNLPNNVDKDKIWNIVTNLEEELYNPEDKVLDYMRSSEYKAGYSKPDDMDPNAKYSRGGTYTQGGMYEADEKGKILHAYDFDDTIAQVKANIRTTITSPKGDYERVIDIPSDKFPEVSKEMEAKFNMMDFDYDFGEFEKQINDAIINSKVVNKLKSSLSNPQIKTTILTARTIGHPVTKFLKKMGLDAYVVPLGLQVGGERVTGQDKADWIENHINKGYKTVYFIDDSEENRTAVAALKDKHPDVNLTVEDPAAVNEMMGMMNKQEKAKHAKNMKRLSKDMSNMKGNNYGGGGYKVPDYVKGTLTRKLYEEMSQTALDAVEDYADDKLDPVDVDLTSKHFFNRLNDPRNDKDISQAELIGFFKRLSKRKKEFIKFLKHYKELVVTDDRTNLNIPFMKLANKVIAKTVMRKKDFQTPNPSLTLEKKYGSQYILADYKDQIKDKYGPQKYRDLQVLMSHNKDEEVGKWLEKHMSKNENFPPYKANQVQQTRYKASDVFTRDVKKAKKMGYKENTFTV